MSEATEVTETVERVREHLAAAVSTIPDEEGYIDFLTEILAALTAATERAEAAEAKSRDVAYWHEAWKESEAERDALRAIHAKVVALTAHMNQVHEELGGTDTVLTLEAAQYVVAERDALRKDVKRLREAIDIFISFQGSTREPEGQAALTAALAVQP